METDKGTSSRKGQARILLVDDHPVVREGLLRLINREDEFTVCGQAEDANTALELIAALSPDIVIIDITLKASSGLDLIKDLKVRYPKLPVLALSVHDESLYAERALRAGAKGYLMKMEAIETVVDAIRRVLKGEIVVSDRIAARMLRKFIAGKPEQTPFPVERLTDRELEVFQLIAQGLTTRWIADRLHLSVKTIETHRAHIKAKLNLKSSTELLLHAARWAQAETGG